MSFRCKYFSFDDAQIQRWKTAFHGIDVIGELLKADEWVAADERRKKKHWKRFAFNWLSKAHRDLLKVNAAVDRREMHRIEAQRWLARNY